MSKDDKLYCILCNWATNDEDVKKEFKDKKESYICSACLDWMEYETKKKID